VHVLLFVGLILVLTHVRVTQEPPNGRESGVFKDCYIRRRGRLTPMRLARWERQEIAEATTCFLLRLANLCRFRELC